MTKIRIGYFSTSPVIAVGRAYGMFARHEITIDAEPVTSSPAQFSSLHLGSYDVVLTSPDNVAAYRFGKENPLGVRMDARIIRAVDGGMGLSLIARAGTRSVGQLRGQVIAVDVPESGFAYALYELLAVHGLRRGDDYDVIAMGATPRRATALRDGHCAATLLNGGLAITARQAGMVHLGRVSEVISPYLGTVLATTGAWLDSHPGIVREFTTAWQESVTAVLTQDIDAVLTEVFHVPAPQLSAMRDVLRSPTEGLVPDGVVDKEALNNVLKLRAKHGPAMYGEMSDGMMDLR